MDMLTDPRTPLRKPLAPIEPLPRPEGVDRIGLVLQGGGALGAYQAGVYQALHEAGLEPDWVVGVSIGAINSAIIAGNKPEHRLEKLERFWMDITASDPLTAWPEGDAHGACATRFSAANTTLFGQPGFFRPPCPRAGSPRAARAPPPRSTTARLCMAHWKNWSIST